MINALFCGNYKVFDGVLTCILSILKRTKTTESFHFHIFTMDVHHLREDYTPFTDSQISFLDSLIKTYNSENKITKYDVTDLYMEHFSGCPNESAYCSPYTLIRLLADLVPLEGNPKKLLYLDADLLFAQDITKLYSIDIADYEYAAAKDHYGKIILFWDRKFINAGVILFNMEECKKSGLFEKSRMWLRKKKLTFADESAIIRSTTKQKKISQRFNDQKFLYKDTVVRHFSKRLFYTPYPHTENIKQWNFGKMLSRFKYLCFEDILVEYIFLKGCMERNINPFHA
jgi:lipopolysaccharide biosynthesis glycosyltransferase